jgi:hypothetical protein
VELVDGNQVRVYIGDGQVISCGGAGNLRNGNKLVQGSRCRVQGSRFKVQDSRFRVQGSGFKVQGSRCRVQGSTLDGGVRLVSVIGRVRAVE